MSKRAAHPDLSREGIFPALVAPFLLIALVIAITFSKIWGDDDVFWHLATGRWIWQHESIPGSDVFGFVSQGRPWIPFEWGWDVMTYALHQLTGGLIGIQILTCVLWAGVYLLLMDLMKHLEVPRTTCLFTLLLTLCLTLDRMTPRPHTVSVLGLTVIMYIYFRFRYNLGFSAKHLYWLPAIFLFWANLHPGVVAGLLLLVLLVVTEGVYILVNRSMALGLMRLERTAYLNLIAATAISTAAMLVNPHALDTYRYLYHHTQLQMLSKIDEWLPPFGAYDTFVLRSYKVMLAMGAVSLYYSFRKRDPFPAVLFLSATAYSLRAVRFIADFAVVIVMGTSLGITYLTTTLSSIKKSLNSPMTSILLSLFLGFAIFTVVDGSAYVRLGMYRHFGKEVDRRFFSFEMIHFLNRERISGRPFHQLEIGGLLVWERPGEMNFIDTRNLSDSLASEYFSIMQMGYGFEKKLERYGIDYIILHPMDLLDSRESMRHTLLPYLSANREMWRLVYWDDQCFVYVKNLSKFSQIIDQFEYKLLHPYLYSYQRHAYDSLRALQPALFKSELDRKLAEEPEGMIVNLLARGAQR